MALKMSILMDAIWGDEQGQAGHAGGDGPKVGGKAGGSHAPTHTHRHPFPQNVDIVEINNTYVTPRLYQPPAPDHARPGDGHTAEPPATAPAAPQAPATQPLHQADPAAASQPLGDAPAAGYAATVAPTGGLLDVFA